MDLCMTTAVQDKKPTRRKVKSGTAPSETPGKRGRPSKFAKLASKDLALQLSKQNGTFVSILDVAELFGVTSGAVRQWIAAKYLPSAGPGIDGSRKLYLRTLDVAAAIHEAAMHQLARF